MDELIIGKEYYVSDWSLEIAAYNKQSKEYKTTYAGNGKFCHAVIDTPRAWKYWVRADEEITPEQLVASILKLIEPLVTCLKTISESLNKWAESEEGKAMLEILKGDNQ